PYCLTPICLKTNVQQRSKVYASQPSFAPDPMTQPHPYHLVVVEAYEGPAEFLSDQDAERWASVGLGLPLEEIADELDSRITILSWDHWYMYEPVETSPMAATRPASFLDDPLPANDSPNITRSAIP